MKIPLLALFYSFSFSSSLFSQNAPEIRWQKCYGGAIWEEAYSAQQTSDGGYVLAGYSNSNDGDVSGNHGLEDYWVVKVDSIGNILWQKSLGGSDHDIAWSVEQTSDSGYIVAGAIKFRRWERQ